MHRCQPLKALFLLGIAFLFGLASLSCSALPRLGNQTERTWGIDREDLRSLFDSAVQDMDPSSRVLLSIDRLEFPENGGLRIFGPCAFDNSPEPEGELAIAFITEDSKVRVEIGGSTCGIASDDPRVSVLNEKMNQALEEKIAAEIGEIQVNRIAISRNQLKVWYVE